MASTAGSVAVGSVVGHGLSNMLFGGGSSHAAAAPEAPVQQQTYQERTMGGACEIQAKDFTQCLSATSNDMSACNFYLEALKVSAELVSWHGTVMDCGRWLLTGRSVLWLTVRDCSLARRLLLPTNLGWSLVCRLGTKRSLAQGVTGIAYFRLTGNTSSHNVVREIRKVTRS